MKTQQEIDKQVVDLKEIRSKIKTHNYFGDSKLDELDAQVKALEDSMDNDDIFDEWPEEESDIYIRTAAEEALNWLEDASEYDDLTECYTIE